MYRPGVRAALHQTLVALLVVAAGPCLAGTAPRCEDRGARSPEARCESIAFFGRERTYRLYVPARLANPAPLLLVLHGGGGGGAGMERLTDGGFNRRADAAGAIVVYPDGVGHSWNDGRHDLKAAAAREHVDDVGYLKALVGSLAARFPIDRTRVFAAGISNGGMMTLRLACEAREVFKGFVAVAASLGEDTAASCAASGIERLAIIDGRDDPLVPWGGGAVSVLGSTRGRVIGAERSYAFFREAAACSGTRAEPTLDRIADDGTAVTLQRALGCTGGADIRLYDIAGGGHAWPGGRRYAREWLIGKVSRELNATDETWRFLGLAAVDRPGPP